MKALQNLTNTEKARLLYDLFPAEIPLFLEDLTRVCEDLKERKETYIKEWDCGLITFEYWFSIAENTADILKRHTFNMKKSSRVFSDQLFFMHNSLFVNDRIVKYADRKSKNEKFKTAVNLLYQP
jgi:hypothetical protein